LPAVAACLTGRPGDYTEEANVSRAARLAIFYTVALVTTLGLAAAAVATTGGRIER
jgi:hypothetical protein